MTAPHIQPVRADANAVSTPQGNLAELMRVQGVALVREHGEPIAPSAITAYLQSIDERLFMRAFPFPTGWEWAFCEKWSETDGRRMSIRTGETPPDRDFDVVGYVPSHLKIKSAEDASAFLVSQLCGNLRSRPDFERYLQSVAEHNDRQSDRNMDPIKAYAQELAEANTQTLFAEQGKTIARVFQNEPKDENGTKRTKGKPADIPSPA